MDTARAPPRARQGACSSRAPKLAIFALPRDLRERATRAPVGARFARCQSALHAPWRAPAGSLAVSISFYFCANASFFPNLFRRAQNPWEPPNEGRARDASQRWLSDDARHHLGAVVAAAGLCASNCVENYRYIQECQNSRWSTSLLLRRISGDRL